MSCEYCEERTSEVNFLEYQNEELEKENQELKDKVEKLTKCVEFYGSSNNLFKYVKDNDLGSSGVSLNYFLHARQTLKEIKEQGE